MRSFFPGRTTLTLGAAVSALSVAHCTIDDGPTIPRGAGGSSTVASSSSSSSASSTGGGGKGGAGGDDPGFVTQALLPGAMIPKFVDELPRFDAREKGTKLKVEIVEFQQKILPADIYAKLPAPYAQGTTLWGYKVGAAAPSFPANTIEATRDVATTITYENDLGAEAPTFLQKYLVTDQTLHWADPLGFSKAHDCMRPPPIPPECTDSYGGPIPQVVHLHGAEVGSASDGHPDAWFTPKEALKGAGFVSSTSTYPNGQEATSLWFHDHTLGRVRLGVYAGLAGMYLLRDARDTGKADNPIGLPAGAYESELMIADRQFDQNGQLFFPSGTPGNPTGFNGPPPNPDMHPYWNPEFFGDVITVNGKSWPKMSVEPRRYRFRVLNGSSARFYRMGLIDDAKQPGPTIWQIGSDGGLLNAPVPHSADPMDPMADPLFLAPAERADVIVDFSGKAGSTFTLVNDAFAPFPSGDPPDPETSGVIMQFKVDQKLQGTDKSFDPKVNQSLRATPIVDIKPTMAKPADKRRQLVLVEVEGPGGPVEVVLNNSHWDGKREGTNVDLPGGQASGFGVTATELPQVGSTEVWEIANLAEDAHPIHIHLVQFQVIDSQPLLAANPEGDTVYELDWMAAFPGGMFGGKSYPPGVFIPGYGPPLDYGKPNAAGALGGNVAFDAKYFDGPPAPPLPAEAGWKDTFKMMPKQVTRVALRWAPQDATAAKAKPGTNLFSFDPGAGGPGYVWHCHILDHEDNEMMRPFLVVK